MDFQACLEILSRAAREGPHAPGAMCCGVSGALAAGLTEGSGPDLRPVIPGDVGFADGDEGADDEPCQPCQPDERARINDESSRGAGLSGTVGGGQVIDWATGTNETIQADLTEAAVLERFPLLGKSVSLDDFQSTACSPAELVTTVVKLHEARVSTHKVYDAAFQHLLASKIGSQHALARMYPFVVSCATARFKTLSDGVRATAASLEEAAKIPGSDSGILEAADLVRKLQSLEQARLQLVASHHVEQSRLKSLPGSDEEVCRGIRRKLGAASEAIEETVSELRYCAADLRD